MDSSPYSQDIPQEIVDQVIDYVQDSPSTLKSCTLISRIWLPRSRTRLFREIEIKPTEEEQKSDSVEKFRDRLQTLIQGTSSSHLLPALSDVTHVLTIDVGGLFSSTEVLNELLGQFPFTSLEEISIRGSPDLPFQKTPLMQLFVKNSQLASIKLTAVMFYNIIDFLEVFTGVSIHTELRYLSLGYIYMTHRPEELKDAIEHFRSSLPSVSRHRPLLSHLQLGMVWGMPDLLTEVLFTQSHSIFDLSALHTLDIQSFGVLIRYIRLVKAVGRNLTTLKFTLAKHNMTQSLTLEPSDSWKYFINLQRLHFIVFYDESEVINKLMQLIPRVLPLLPRLQHFVLGFYFYRKPNSDFSERFWDDLSAQIDPVLAELPATNEWLKDITVNVPTEYNPGVETMQTFFKETCSLGLLNFCFDNSENLL